LDHLHKRRFVFRLACSKRRGGRLQSRRVSDYEQWEVWDGPLETGWWVVRLEDDDIVDFNGPNDYPQHPLRFASLGYYTDADVIKKLRRIRRAPVLGTMRRIRVDGGFIRFLREVEEAKTPHWQDRVSLWVGAIVLASVFNPLTLTYLGIWFANR
jgi:hypothetical protein